ncbi:MAG TPA: hypothetical protein VNN20_14470 [Thermodesulfobacteriota bacterium]|nr:hypothetical protein [Thermodesulfobacteriota bacterium]
MESKIQEIIEWLQSSNVPDVTAWCFLEQYLTTPSKRYKRYYPGIFLVVKKT